MRIKEFTTQIVFMPHRGFIKKSRSELLQRKCKYTQFLAWSFGIRRPSGIWSLRGFGLFAAQSTKTKKDFETFGYGLKAKIRHIFIQWLWGLRRDYNLCT